jgi:hypothetical protein
VRHGIEPQQLLSWLSNERSRKWDDYYCPECKGPHKRRRVMRLTPRFKSRQRDKSQVVPLNRVVVFSVTPKPRGSRRNPHARTWRRSNLPHPVLPETKSSPDCDWWASAPKAPLVPAVPPDLPLKTQEDPVFYEDPCVNCHCEHEHWQRTAETAYARLLAQQTLHPISPPEPLVFGSLASLCVSGRRLLIA